MRKFLVIASAVLMCFGFSACSNNTDVSTDSSQTTQQSEEPVAEPTKEPEPTPNPTPEPKKELTFGDTFEFDDLEITFGSTVEWDTLENQFSDQNGADVFRIAITVKNISAETHGLNMFYYNQYGSKGTKLDTVWTYFDEDISNTGDMRSNATAEAYMYFLYDGDGDYYVEFENFSSKIEVKFPIKK